MTEVAQSDPPKKGGVEKPFQSHPNDNQEKTYTPF